MPTAPRSSIKVHSAAIRLTTSSGVNIGAIPPPLSDAAGCGLKPLSMTAVHFGAVIPEIDIWRAAQLMLKRYGERALEEAPLGPTSSHPPAITTTPRPGAGSWRPSPSSSLRDNPVYRVEGMRDRFCPTAAIHTARRDRAPARACREAAGAADKLPASDGDISVISPGTPTLSQIVQVLGAE